MESESRGFQPQKRRNRGEVKEPELQLTLTASRGRAAVDRAWGTFLEKEYRQKTVKGFRIPKSSLKARKGGCAQRIFEDFGGVGSAAQVTGNRGPRRGQGEKSSPCNEVTQGKFI